MIYLLYDPCSCIWNSESEFDHLLPDARLAKAVRYKRLSDRLLSRTAYFLLCCGLMREYGTRVFPELSIRAGGKPYICGYPDVHFSFSHCSGGVICSISKNETGADIETVNSYQKELFSNVLSENEIAHIEKSSDPDAEFTAVWTMKEAYGKMSGTGLVYDLKNTSFVPVYEKWYTKNGLSYFSRMNYRTVFSVCRQDISDICEISHAELLAFLRDE